MDEDEYDDDNGVSGIEEHGHAVDMVVDLEDDLPGTRNHRVGPHWR